MEAGWLVELLGAIPVPGDIEATKNFMNRIENRINRGYSISIYPEAHIWPYYTKIRPFTSVSFKYAVKYNVPAFCITNTYQKNNNKVQMISYIDGPFFADKDLKPKEAQDKLRNEIYETMCIRSKESNVEVIKYIKKDEIS